MSEPLASPAVALEVIPCPNCRSDAYSPWASERGYQAVRCAACSLIYVNPRPSRAAIDAAVAAGAHVDETGSLDVSARRIGRKVARYRRVLRRIFADRWNEGKPVSWLDVGAGYGELLEAVVALAPPESVIEGLEPMKPKADHARARGLRVTQDWLRPARPKVDVVSLVDVFSHVPDFGELLADVRSVLRPGGDLFLETGNLADVQRRDEFPNELGLPDHLVFAGEQQLRAFLGRAGFAVVALERHRFDGVANLIKCLVKKALGRPVIVRLPYRSAYRQLILRARLVQ